MENEFLSGKRQRYLANATKPPANLKIIECIREFKLPQAYPSLANGVVKPVAEKPPTPSAPAGLKKLKLIAKNGRDLGEFNVRTLRPNEMQILKKSLSSSTIGQLKQKDAGLTLKPDQKHHVGFKNVMSQLKPSAPMHRRAITYVTPPNLILNPGNAIKTLENTSVYRPASSKTTPNSEQIFTTASNSMFMVQSGDNWQVIQLNENGHGSLPAVQEQIPRKRLQENVGNNHNADSTDHRIPQEVSNDLPESAKVPKKQRKPKLPSSKPAVARKRGKKKDPDDAEGSNGVEQESCEVEHASKQLCLRNSLGTVNLIRRGRREPPTVTKPIVQPKERAETESLVGKPASEPPSRPDSAVSSDLSIVGQALSMIGDEEMRNKALQALAECGIGIERLIPAKPPPDQMSVNESQTQTNVFGLLDDNMAFVRVSGDAEGVDRLQEIERHIIVDDENIPLRKFRRQAEFANQLNDMLDQHWVNKNGVEQVKELLKVDPMVEKAYSLLERDFTNLRVYDQKGLLSIHRAVLSDRANLVKRQIMVLRSCKESVDIFTEDGQTALELAVEHFASPTIVHLLLKSGASPTRNISAQDSALTIASRDSSPYLSQLIKYVSTSGDLNFSDSEGFCALHYCALNGNHEGVKALIRANVDLNVRDRKSGRTPLFHAFENEYIPIVKDLLTHGAKGHLPTFAGHTVMTIFDEEKHFALKDALFKSMK